MKRKVFQDGIGCCERPSAAAVAAFLDKISFQARGGCWFWTGCTDKWGYGKCKADGRTWWAHRLSYLIFNGELEDGMHVGHITECANTSCVNPDHLEQVTPSENIAERNTRVAEQRAAEAAMDDIPF